MASPNIPGCSRGRKGHSGARSLQALFDSADFNGRHAAGSSAKSDSLGTRRQAKMEAGELVPDEVVCGIVEQRIGQPDCQRGFILDGFPRTLAQAEFVDRMLQAKGKGNPLVLDIKVDRDLLLKRLTGRRTCSVCGEIYNVYLGSPKVEGVCDKDGGKLLQRVDDSEETIRQRLVAYEKQTSPLIDYYRRKGVLQEVNGNRGPEPIAKELIDFLGKA